jgi:hypothetical protein
MAFAVAGLFLLVGAFQLVLCAGSSPVQPTAAIPPGTILPIRLDDAFEAASAHADQHFEARIAQQVPLSGKEKISLRSRVIGTVVSVSKDSSAGTVKVSLKFDQLEEKKEIFHITTSLRALASYQAARTAETPLTGADSGTPSGWGTTVQIGGDQRFGNGGRVRNRQKQTVGKGVVGGVLVHLAANASVGCDGPEAGNDRLQALWVFSADACGVYDLKNVKIAKNGKTDPVGVITLEFAKDDVKLESGTALLLRTMRQP